MHGNVWALEVHHLNRKLLNKQASKATSIHSVSFKITENGLSLARHGRLDFFGLGKEMIMELSPNV